MQQNTPMLNPQDNSQYTAKDNPDYREREIIREQDFPKSIIELLKNHDHHFDPATQYQIMLGLRFTESEATLFGNLNTEEIRYLDSEVSSLMSVEKMSLPRSVTEKMEYWDTREWQKVFLFIKNTRMRYGAEMYHSTVRREELSVTDDRDKSMLVGVGEAAKDTPLNALPNRFRGVADGFRGKR
jgi:hypothetical protein